MSADDDYIDIKNRFAAVARRALSTKAGSGGDGPGGLDMEQRVELLEKNVGDIKAALGRLEPKISALHMDVAEMKGRLSGMPTTWQLVGLVFAIFAAAFALLKLAN